MRGNYIIMINYIICDASLQVQVEEGCVRNLGGVQVASVSCQA